MILVLTVVAASLWIVADNHFKRGTVLFALAICLAALLRAMLPNGAVGMLRVRSRFLDVLTMAGAGRLHADCRADRAAPRLRTTADVPTGR